MQRELPDELLEVQVGDGNDDLGDAGQTEAVASLREFVAVAVHDLRGAQGALLTATNLFASARDETSRASLSACIEREAAHLSRLTDDLYLLSVADTGQLEVRPDTVELEPILRQAAAESGDREIEVQGAAGLLVHADPCHIRRIVANLVRNAFAHGAPPVRITAATHEGRVEIRVTDAGPGVPQPFVPRLFTRFTRAGGTTRGAGLGLAIVAELARLNGGSTRYEPHPAGRPGATFVVRLPQRPVPKQPVTRPGRQPCGIEGRRDRPGRTGPRHGGAATGPLLAAIAHNHELAAHVRSTLEETLVQTLATMARSGELRIRVRESMRTRRRLLHEGSALADETPGFEGLEGPQPPKHASG